MVDRDDLVRVSLWIVGAENMRVVCVPLPVQTSLNNVGEMNGR